MRHIIDPVQVSLSAIYDKDTEHGSHIPDHIHIGRVGDLHSVHDEIVAVKLRFERLRQRILPYSRLIIHHFRYPRLVFITVRREERLLGNAVSGHLHRICIRSEKTESDSLVIIYLRRDKRLRSSPDGLLSKSRKQWHEKQQKSRKKDILSHMSNYSAVSFRK